MIMQADAHSRQLAKERMVGRLRTLKGLPTTVAVAVRLFQLHKSDATRREPQPADYARIIATDAGMTARILALANSSYFGLSMRITQPTVAVNLLGVAAVRTLAINFCLSGLHHELKLTRTESKWFWEASLCKAVAARQLARHLDAACADDAYVAGLFQDIALPVMFATARDLMGPMLEQRLAAVWRLAGERELLDADHAELGALFARSLGLSEGHARLIGAHHDQAGLRGAAESAALAAGAYAASLFPHRLDQWDAADVETLRAFLAGTQGGGLVLEDFLAEVSSECQREFAYFDRANVTEVKLLELMGEALAQAAEAAAQLVGQVHALRNQVASADAAAERSREDHLRLAEQALQDPLTGVLNRAGFERQCQPALAAAQHRKEPAAMLFLDLDHFKRVNDVQGHTAGDRALRMVAGVLRECTRGTDIVGRVGGDEFAILLPNCPRANALEIGERIRQRVAMCQSAAHGVSVSVGIRWAARVEGMSLESLMTASDQRMYAAKRAGGNSISVEVS